MAHSPPAERNDGLVTIRTMVLQSVFMDLEIKPERVRTLEEPSGAPPIPNQSALVGVAAESAVLAQAAPAILAFADPNTGQDGALFVFCLGERTDAELAGLRTALWPAWHVVALYRMSNAQVTRVALDGTRPLRRGAGMRGIVLVARRRAAVLAPDVTTEKFDKNAQGWNGTPGAPGYAHFRWMRRFVGTFADASRARRILDFGCGAGWVGIEAALVAQKQGAVSLCAFDPSPEMVRLATENARAAGIASFEGRTGFGEAPPFGVGEAERFDLVLCSGVISFSGDTARWLDGLVATLAPGGTLVIGDIHRDSTGMRRRRQEKPLLPVREMNASLREDVRRELEARGLVFEAWCGYQLSRPVPQLLHFSATRLGGALDGLLLSWNQRASRRDLAAGSRQPDRFDSWVMRFTAPPRAKH